MDHGTDRSFYWLRLQFAIDDLSEYIHDTMALTCISLIMFVGWVNCTQAGQILHSSVHRAKHGPKIWAMIVDCPVFSPDLSSFVCVAVSG